MCLMIVVLLFLAVPLVCLHLVIGVFPDHTHLLLISNIVAFTSIIFKDISCFAYHTRIALKHKKTDLSLETSLETNFKFIKFLN